MVIVVTGVAGSGKSTVGTMLAAALDCPYLEGDSLHSRENIDKMSQGIPLTDADRGPWLSAIHARMLDSAERGQNLVVGCSALKAQYRELLARGVPIRWVFLNASRQLIRERLAARRQHFMKVEMLESQFDSLEAPTDAIVVDAAEPLTAIVEHIQSQLRDDRPYPPEGGRHN